MLNAYSLSIMCIEKESGKRFKLEITCTGRLILKDFDFYLFLSYMYMYKNFGKLDYPIYYCLSSFLFDILTMHFLFDYSM